MHNAIPGARRAFALAAETTVQARPGATQAGASIGSARQIAQAAPVESCRTPTDSRLNWRPAPAPPAVTASTPADNPLRRNNAARHGPVRTRRRRPHTDAPVPSSRCPAFDTAANTNAVASATTPPHSTRTGCAPRPPGIRAAHRRTERRAPPRRSARLEDPDPLSAVVAASVFTWGFPPPRCVFRPHSAPFSRIGSTARCQKTDKCCRSATRKGPPPAENLTPRGGDTTARSNCPPRSPPGAPLRPREARTVTTSTDLSQCHDTRRHTLESRRTCFEPSDPSPSKYQDSSTHQHERTDRPTSSRRRPAARAPSLAPCALSPAPVALTPKPSATRLRFDWTPSQPLASTTDASTIASRDVHRSASPPRNPARLSRFDVARRFEVDAPRSLRS